MLSPPPGTSTSGCWGTLNVGTPLSGVFRRPPTIQRWRWPQRIVGCVLVGTILVIGLLAWLLRPATWTTNASDRIATEGAIFAAGTFVLAVLGSSLALVAYVNSSLRPQLSVAQFIAHVAPDSVADYIRPDFYRYCSLWLTLENNGTAAARHVSIRVTFKGAGFEMGDESPTQVGQWHRVLLPDMTNTYVWEGGAATLIHPDWPYMAPELGSGNLTLDRDSDGPAMVEVTIVADGVPSHTEMLKVVDRGAV